MNRDRPSFSGATGRDSAAALRWLADALHTLSPANVRWPVALRAALSVGVPVLAGWWLHDVAAGLTATLGSFTALYASDRPYRNRALVLALLALAFACAVTAGVWAQHVPWLAVPLVTVVAMLATFLAATLRIGPPGAYMLVLACAAGTSLPVSRMPPLQLFLLVLSGGTVAWLVHLAGAVRAPRGPERAVVAQAARAVAALVDTACDASGEHRRDAVHDDAHANARHAAALALHAGWIALVNRQPRNASSDRVIAGLRHVHAESHALFAASNALPEPDPQTRRLRAARARAIAESAAAQPVALDAFASTAPLAPLGQPTVPERLVTDLQGGSRSWTLALRVGVAVALAGAAGMLLGLSRAYWAMAAAVLVLHQGLGLLATLRRSIDRTLGTLAGLVLAGVVLALHPAGLALVLVLAALQCLVELFVTRNYAMAVVFVTAMALTVASGGHAVADPVALLAARGVDTATGCVIGMLVRAAWHWWATRDVVADVSRRTFVAMRDVLAHLRDGDVMSPDALRARQRLQGCVIEGFNVRGTERPARASEAAVSPVASGAMQDLGYALLGCAWLMQTGTIQPVAAGPEAPHGARHDDELDALQRVLDAALDHSIEASIDALDDSATTRRTTSGSVDSRIQRSSSLAATLAQHTDAMRRWAMRQMH